MENPWAALPSEPDYVLQDDRPFVEAFNRQIEPRHPHWLDLSLIPGPFEGDRQARLLVLMRNPGIGDWGGDPGEIRGFCRGDPGFQAGHVKPARPDLLVGAMKHLADVG